MKKHAEIVSVISLVLVLLFFAGCKTVPSAAKMADPVDFLPDDADIYFRIDAAENTSLLNAIVGKYIPAMAESDRQKLINMIELVYVAQNTDTRQVFVTATGSFPSLKSLAFTKKNGWNEVENKMYWNTPSGKKAKITLTEYIHESGVRIAFPDKNLVFMSNSSLQDMQDKFAECLINGELNHLDILSENDSIAFYVSEPKMNTLGLSILNALIGNVSIVQGTAEKNLLSETVAEKPVQFYSVNCGVILKEKRALVPVRLLISKALGVETETAEDGAIMIHDYRIEEDKLISYFIGG